jgi:hypothetical protein
MDDTGWMLSAIFTEGAALQRVAGMSEVVRLLLDYTSFDERWRKWQRLMAGPICTLCERYNKNLLEQHKSLLHHFIRRLNNYPRITPFEEITARTLLGYIKRALTINWRLDNQSPNFFETVALMHDVFRTKPFSGHSLTQEVYRTHGLLNKQGRFPQKELTNMNYDWLVTNGIDITSIDDDFKGCSAVLTTSRNEWVNVAVRLSNDYPFRSPEVIFKGGIRPRRFAKRSTIVVDEYYEYAYSAVEDTLRAVLLDMEMDGVCEVGTESPVLFL